MKVQLLVSEWCPSCHQAEAVWREVEREREIDFAVVDMGQPEGRELVSRLRLKTVPSVVIDGELKGVGVQTRQEALEMVAGAPAREAGVGAHHVGISMERTGRIQVLSSLSYLVLAGGGFFGPGGLLGVGEARVPVLHLYTLGFVTFMIYAVGEHMLPRFTGRPIRGGGWAWTQIALAHLGLLAFAGGLWLGLEALALAGAVAAWCALALFTARLWPVLQPGVTAPAGAAGEEGPPLAGR
ncbi:MAG: hypothetical protein GWO02_22310 [Gammaproteobacteria bacterium]|nr:hypothetical protein [Gammaproteobacteria bacterium]